MTPYSGTLIQAKEETEERTVSRPAGENEDTPDYESQSYKDQIGDVKFMRAVVGGTKTMREQKEDFLPRHPMEDRDKYADRLKQAVAYNATRRTVRGLTGMIFRRDPTLSEDMPQEIQDHLLNVDLRGNDFAVFARQLSENSLTDGHSWLHVESPRVDPVRVRTRAESRAAGVRPYWIEVAKEDAINWRYELRGGEPILTLFVYKEGASEPDGDFREKSVSRVRVLREDIQGETPRVIGELWEKVEQEGEADRWVRLERYVVDIPRIPVVAVYGNRTDIFTSEPPLLDLAYEQVEHYRVRSDRQKSMTFASIAVPYLFGEGVMDDEGIPKVTWGPDGMMVLNDPEAKTGMVESQGHGLEATKDELQEIQSRMASLGLQMLVRETRGAETEGAKLIDKSESDAALSIFARGVEDACNVALELHGLYRKVDNPGTVRFNRDYHTQIVDPQLVKQLNEAVAAGHLSLETLWWILVQGETLPEEFDPEEERERIARDAAMGLDPLEQQFQDLEREVREREGVGEEEEAA